MQQNWYAFSETTDLRKLFVVSEPGQAHKLLRVSSWLLTWLRFPHPHRPPNTWRFEKDLNQCPPIPKCHQGWANRLLSFRNLPCLCQPDWEHHYLLFQRIRPKGLEIISIIIWQRHYRDSVEFYRCVHPKKYEYSSSCTATCKQSKSCVWSWASEKPKFQSNPYYLVVLLAILFYQFLMVEHFFLEIFGDVLFVDSQYESWSIIQAVIVIFGESMLGRQGLSLVLRAKSQFNIILRIIFQIFKPKNVLLTLILTTPFPLDPLHWILNILIIQISII